MTAGHPIGLYCDFVRPAYADRDAGHDFDHIRRIIDRLPELAEGLDPPPVPHRLSFLATFHGLIGKITGDPEFRDRAVRFLTDLGWPEGEITTSFAALARHLSNPQTPEECMVHDANFFEVTGPFGIAKAFTVGGAHGQRYEQTLDIFAANLEALRFRTPAGQALYEPRKAYAAAFIQDLRGDLRAKPDDDVWRSDRSR